MGHAKRVRKIRMRIRHRKWEKKNERIVQIYCEKIANEMKPYFNIVKGMESVAQNSFLLSENLRNMWDRLLNLRTTRGV